MREQGPVKALPACSILNFSPFSVSLGDRGCVAISTTHSGIQDDLLFPLFICSIDLSSWAMSTLQLFKSLFLNSTFSINRLQEAGLTLHTSSCLFSKYDQH